LELFSTLLGFDGLPYKNRSSAYYVSKARRESLAATVHFYSALMVRGSATKSRLMCDERDEMRSWAVEGSDQGKMWLITRFILLAFNQ